VSDHVPDHAAKRALAERLAEAERWRRAAAVVLDEVRARFAGEGLMTERELRGAIEAIDAPAPPPCGGSRCWRAPDGKWIHSSKSYGTCSAAEGTGTRDE
jgi:hypothetical protein